MKEISRLLFVSPVLSTELIATTVCAHILALATPIFVILVLNRYVMYGFDGTLFTLTAGATIAVGLEYIFRRLRHRFASASVEGLRVESLSNSFYTLISSKELAIESLPYPTKRKIFHDAKFLKSFASSENIGLILDAPFSVIYILAIYLLSPWLALITLALCGTYFIAATYWSYRLGKQNIESEKIESKRTKLIDFGIVASESVRLFGMADSMLKDWSQINVEAKSQESTYADKRNSIQGRSRLFTAILSIIVIALGAQFVVSGTLDVGSLIGINILAARAAIPIVGAAHIFDNVTRVKLARRAVDQFNKLPQPPDRKISLQNYQGKLQLEQIYFSYLHARRPIINALNVEIEPGEVVVIKGANGTGKTTLIKLLTGLLEPSSGSVLIDDINLQQIAPEWWRKQIVYMPQEPTFFHASVQENMAMHRRDASISDMQLCMEKVGLGYLVHDSEEGLQTNLDEGGRQLSLGVRRRLSLARVLLYDGPLVILDEPTENIDAEGRQHIYKLLNDFAAQGKTIICATMDPNIIKGAAKFIELSPSQEPKILESSSTT